MRILGITSNGIWNNNKRNVKVVDGTGYTREAPNTYLIELPIDTVLFKGANCKVIFPKNPPQGYTITIFDKSDMGYFSSNGANVVYAGDYGGDMEVVVNGEFNHNDPWRFTYIDGIWYHESLV